MRKVLFIAMLAIALLVAACAPAPTPAPTAAPPTAAPKPTEVPKPVATSAPAATVAAPATAPSTSAAADFYKDKTVTLLTDADPGSLSDLWCRAIAAAMPQTTGAKWVVKNETAGGGRVTLNDVYTIVKPDGLSLLFEPAGSMWPGYMNDDPTVKYDITKWVYVGGTESGNFLLAVSPKGKIKTVDDLMKAKGLKFAATNKSTAPTMANALAMSILNLDGSIITGFQGSVARQLAIQQGDADVTVSSPDVVMQAAQQGILMPIVQVGTVRTKPADNVPTMMEFVKQDSLTDTQKRLLASMDILSDAKSFMAPPGTPQDRVDFLSNAFKQALETTNMTADITKATGQVVQPYVSGAELLRRATALAAKKADMKLWGDLLDKYVK